MNVKPWLFSLLTAAVLAAVALVNAFFLMWGMMHYKTDVKPYAYALFGLLSFLIILFAALAAGPLTGLAARRLIPGGGWGELLLYLAAGVVTVVVGSAALFITMPLVLAVFDDPLPREGSMMRVRFPEGAKLVHRSNHNAQTYDTKLIVRLDPAGWEDFRRNELFRPSGLAAVPAGPGGNLRDWNTFETSEGLARSYRWTNHGEPALLKVLAVSDGRGQIYVYLYLIRNYREGQG